MDNMQNMHMLLLHREQLVPFSPTTGALYLSMKLAFP